MLASLERIRNLISRPAHSYRASLETFADLDTQRLGSDLRLDQRGKQSGKQNQPAQDSSSFDATETEIIEQIGAAQKLAHDQLENHLAGFRQRLIDLDFETRFAKIKNASSSGLSDLKAELNIGVDELHGLRKDLQGSEDWLSDFRTTHRIKRPARITTTTGTILKWMVIVLIVLIELVVNGELLSKGSEMGVIGGIVEAVIFAVLNVGVALLFAIYAVPLITHRSFFAKLLGFVALVAYLGTAIAINLGLAHYREVAGALLSGGTDVGSQVMQRLRTTPLELTDFKSWLLFALGLLFSIIAFIDGLNLRDTYPQYARVSKAVRTARANYMQRRQELIDELSDVRREGEESIAEARADLGRQRTEHDAIVSHRARMLSLFDEHQSQLERAANVLLRQYRDANVAARTTPQPPRFSVAYSLNRIQPQISREGEYNPETLKAEIKEAQGDLDRLVAELGRQFSVALDRYSELDVLAPGK